MILQDKSFLLESDFFLHGNFSDFWIWQADVIRIFGILESMNLSFGNITCFLSSFIFKIKSACALWPVRSVVLHLAILLRPLVPRAAGAYPLQILILKIWLDLIRSVTITQMFWNLKLMNERIFFDVDLHTWFLSSFLQCLQLVNLADYTVIVLVSQNWHT